MFRTTSIGLAFLAAALLILGGCGQPVPPALKPLSKQARNLLAKKGMREEAPIFIRIFKAESELEVWKLRDDGEFALFKTYDICKWSGELGPKLQEGDRQAPEGFYQVRASQMNPNSNYHLAFNLGFPNKYDKANSRTGAHLMVHGDCKSAGCYAMTDALIEEIYSLAREAFKGGQEVFHVHAFPFRMTEANLQAHRGNKWYGFWRSLKEGHDYFEKVKHPPEVQVCERRYLVNASFINASTSVDPRDACPPYRILPMDLFPRPAYTQEARNSTPSSTGSVDMVASTGTPSFSNSVPYTPAPRRAAAQTSANAAAQASLLASRPQPAQPRGDQQAGAQQQQQNGQGSTAKEQQSPTFSPAAQATIRQGSTFQFAPTSPPAGNSFQFNSMSSQ